MKVFKMWKDFESEAINDKDLLKFAIDLWRRGQIKVSTFWDNDNDCQITRYEIIVAEE